MNGWGRLGTLAVCVGAILITGAAQHAAAKSLRFEQEEFVIAFWGDPPVDNRLQARYQEVSDAHFNVVLGGMGADTPTKAREQRDASEKVGIQVIFATYGLPVEALCNCPTTYGFLVRDHPSADDFRAVKQRANEVRRERPGKLPFINLYAATAPPADLGAASYAEYMSDFISIVRPEVLCFEYFPDFDDHGLGQKAYCENLAAIRAYALGEGIPFWNFFRAMAYESTPTPTNAQIRWQVYTSITYGAKGIVYFAYWTPATDPKATGDGLITPKGKQTSRYDFAKQLNAAVQNLGPTLMSLESTDVRLVNSGSGQDALKGLPVTSIAAVGEDTPREFLIGSFSGEDGRKGVMLTNYSVEAEPVLVTVVFAGNDNLREVSKASGKPVAAVDALPDEAGLQLEFEGGEGRLFLLD